jgi:hypothetical protein
MREASLGEKLVDLLLLEGGLGLNLEIEVYQEVSALLLNSLVLAHDGDRPKAVETL